VGISPEREGANFLEGEIGQRNVSLTYRKNVVLQCTVDVDYPRLSDWTRLQWALRS